MPRVHLPDGRVVHFPDTMAPADIEREVSKLAPTEPPPPDEAKPPAAPQRGAGMEAIARKVASVVPESTPIVGLPIHALANVENLPTMGGAVGGTVGGLAGGVGAVPGAALGGAAGEGARRIIRGEPLDEVTGYAGAAATEAANELGGRLIPGGIKAGGTAIYDLAVSPARSLKKAFPGLSQAAIDAGAWLPTSKRFGADKVQAARKASAAEAAGEFASQLPPGARIKTDVPLKELGELRKRVAMNPRARQDLQAIDEFAAEVRASHPKGFSDKELIGFKQAGAGKASTHYRAAEQGNLAGALEADMNAAVSKGARKFIEATAPASKAANARTQALIGAQRALEDAGGRSNALRYAAAVPAAGAATMAGVPAGVAAGVAALAAIPQIGGPAGFALNRGGQLLSRAQLPNVARVIEMLKRQQTLDQLGSEP